MKVSPPWLLWILRIVPAAAFGLTISVTIGLVFAQQTPPSQPVTPQPAASSTASPAAQGDKEKDKDGKPKAEEEGIPVTSDLVRQACGACHKSDEKKRMTRISARRTTPEGWQETIRRMVSLNGVQLEPDTARQVLRYLANNHGLAPEEALPASFEVEKRMIDYKYPDKDTEGVCHSCHSMGRVISQRRTKSDWELLVAMHRGYYPLSDFQAFRRFGPPQTQPGPDGRPPDNRQPMDKAIANLSGAYPLVTPEWSAWSANMRPAHIAGTWAVTGKQPGKGLIYGTMTIRAKDGADDEFTTETKLISARNGETASREGKVIVYTGFQWRGRSTKAGADTEGLREVMFIDRNLQSIKGRWYTGGYDEIGMDVELVRIGAGPVVEGLDHPALSTGATSDYTLYGANLPAGLRAADVDFGPGVKVNGVTPVVAGSQYKLNLSVAADAKIGRRDLFVAGVVKEGAAVVFDKVDEIKVTPTAGMARLGGINFPKQFQQFEVVAYNYGPDGKPDTKDDLELGTMSNVTWSIEEYAATYGDDDIKYVGTIDQNGFFTPNVDGPNPQRPRNANNVGDVWVVATLKRSGKDKDGKELKPLRARAHLLVTVPLYMRWDTAEVGGGASK
jgi:quinohemoprotein amine dehydrogenase